MRDLLRGYLPLVYLRYEKEKISKKRTVKGFRFQTKFKNPELTDASFHLFYSLRDVAGMFFAIFQDAAEVIETKVKVEHTPFWEQK